MAFLTDSTSLYISNKSTHSLCDIMRNNMKANQIEMTSLAYFALITRVRRA